MESNEQPIFFRFGEWAKDEQSYIYANHSETVIGREKGVSVFEAHKDRNGNYLPVPPSPLNESGWNDYTMWLYYRWNDEPKFIVTGDVVGIGTDNEPLLRNIKIISKVERNKP